MFTILEKKQLTPNTYWFEVKAPLVSHSRKAGQFMVICPHTKAERIPISLAGSNLENDSIYFVIHAVGKTTQEICALNVGDSFLSILGPLGMPSPIENYGTVVCIGGGYGVAASLPIADELRQAGNRVIGVIGARSEDLILLKEEMGQVCDELRLCSNDGSVGTKGLVTDVVNEILAEGIKIDHVFAIGPVPMMKALSDQTKKLGIGCTVSLNPIMVDGTGMCGACRVLVGGKPQFACYHGPDFNGHEVDFDDLQNRLRWYSDETKISRPLGSDGDHAPICPHQSTIEELEKHWIPKPGEKLSPKDRMQIPRQPMPEQTPAARIRNFDEVAQGLTEEQALAESQRCLTCAKPACVDGCPVGVDIPRFIGLVQQGRFVEAAAAVAETNVLASVCGRVCPQETQCEIKCIVGKKNESVAIGRLERFVADYVRKFGGQTETVKPAPTGMKVAVIGSGPAGLTVAGDLIRKGHEVHVMEGLHKVGGVLIYGIPEFRMPNVIVENEVNELTKLGVQFHTNYLVGKAKTIDQFFEKKDLMPYSLAQAQVYPR